MFRAIALVCALLATPAMAQLSKRIREPSQLGDSVRSPIRRVSAFVQAPLGSPFKCGLPAGETFPGYVGRVIVAPNAADTAEVTRGYMADGSDMGVTAGTGPKECAWTPPNASDCVRAEVVTGTGAAVPRIVAGSVPESIRTLPASDHTMYFVVNPRNTAATRHLYGYGDPNEDGLLVNSTAGAINVAWYGAGVSVIRSTVAAIDKVTVVAIRKSGTTFSVCANGLCTGSASANVIVNPGADDAMWIGATIDGTAPLNGANVADYFFSTAHSDDTIKNFTAQVMCSFGSTPTGQVNITDTRSGGAGEMGPTEKENLVKCSENLEDTTAACWVNSGTMNRTANQAADSTGAMTLELLESVTGGAMIRPTSGVAVADGVSTYIATAEARSVTGTQPVRFNIVSSDAAASCSTGDTTLGTAITTVSCTTPAVAAAGSTLTVRIYPGGLAAPGTGSSYFGRVQLRRTTAPTDYVRTYADARPAGPFFINYGDNARWATPNGLLNHGQVINYWNDSTAAGSWVNSGTPVIASNIASGPYSRWAGGPEVDTIEDDDAAVAEGKASAAIGAAAGDVWTASCEIAADVSTVGRLDVFVTGGTGSTNCVKSGLTSTFERHSCTTPALGAGAASVRAFIYPADQDNVTDLGKIKVSECELTKTPVAVAPCPGTGVGPFTCGADKHLFPAPVGPTLTEGCAKVCITPSWTGANPFGAAVYHLWARNVGGTARLAYTNASQVTIAAYDGTTAVSVAADYVAGATKCYVTDWSAPGNFLRITNQSSGAVGSVAFAGFPGLDAEWALGSTTSGTNNGNASYSGLKFGSGPGQCN